VNTILIVLGLFIIVALGAYAAGLLLTLRRQGQERQRAEDERRAAVDAKRAAVFEDIRYIAAAMIEDRCEISEGVFRIAKLFDTLSLSERVAPDYPQLFKHFERIKDHPIMEARKALPKQERMKLDLQRMKSESELAEGILADVQRLKDFELKASH
jgi:uncharacterized membrane-anchored protein YhcB (DUF1043 family)